MNAMTNLSTLTQASHQWALRADDERFASLLDMQMQVHAMRNASRQRTLSSRSIEAVPIGNDHKGLGLMTPDGVTMPTHWSFGQLAERAGAPAAYLRKLPTEIAADCINYGLVKERSADVGLLSSTYASESATLMAATGPGYGRVWNSDVIDALVHQFGDGVSGQFRVPGEFGQDVTVTKANTTLFASDRDMFVFLADEKNRIEIPGRRSTPGGAHQDGTMARGFFVWNSEVGAQTLGIAMFLFDYTCCNRIVWGAEGYNEIRIRHTAAAPDRFIEEVKPAVLAYADSATANIREVIDNARQAKIADDIEDFLTKRRFSWTQAKAIMVAHQTEENRPIETVWDAVTGITAYAKGIGNQDNRIAVERMGGKLLDLVA